MLSHLSGWALVCIVVAALKLWEVSSVQPCRDDVCGSSEYYHPNFMPACSAAGCAPTCSNFDDIVKKNTSNYTNADRVIGAAMGYTEVMELFAIEAFQVTSTPPNDDELQTYDQFWI